MASDAELLKINIIGANTKINSIFGRSTADNVFEVNYIPTQGVDICTKGMVLNNKPVKLILVITAGEEFFGKLRPSYYRGASACIILFDKKERKSFKAVEAFYESFIKYVPNTVPIGVVGIQLKLKNLGDSSEGEIISSEEGIQLANKLNCSYFETELQNKDNIDDILQCLAKQAIT